MSDMYGNERAIPTPLHATMAARVAALIVASLILAGVAVPAKMAAGRRDAGAETAPVAAATLKSADVNIGALPPPARETVYVGTDGQRITPARIHTFLARQGSPMAGYSTDIVEAGLRYGVDPRVVVAIAGVESTYGIYSHSYNAWGWNAGKTHWSSWAVAIERFTKALGSSYRSLRHGRFAAASRTYCPPCGKRWGVKALGIFKSI